LSTGSAGLPKNVLLRSMPSDVNIMEIHTDFKELLELFNKNKVKLKHSLSLKSLYRRFS